MKKNVFEDRSYGDFTNFFIPLTLVEIQVTGVARVEHNAR